jgi:molecular chaperone GrpE
MNDNDKSKETTPDVAAPSAAAPAAGSAPGSAAGSAAQALAARNAELEGQIGDLTDRLLRAHADMDNLRKRTEREKSDSAKYAISKFALDIVGVSDNFQRAVTALPAGAAEADGTLKSIVDGVMMTERAFLQVLERHGVRRIDPKGEPFNPNMHQAVMEQDNPEVPAGSVLQVFQPGFMIEERVLRPAMVVVARGGGKAAKSAEAQGQPSMTEPSVTEPSRGDNNGQGGAA